MKIKIFKENTKYFNISFNEASDMYTIVLAMLFNWDSKTRSTSVHNLTERDVKMLEEIKDRLHDYFKVHF